MKAHLSIVCLLFLGMTALYHTVDAQRHKSCYNQYRNDDTQYNSKDNVEWPYTYAHNNTIQ